MKCSVQSTDLNFKLFRKHSQMNESFFKYSRNSLLVPFKSMHREVVMDRWMDEYKQVSRKIGGHIHRKIIDVCVCRQKIKQVVNIKREGGQGLESAVLSSKAGKYSSRRSKISSHNPYHSHPQMSTTPGPGKT